MKLFSRMSLHQAEEYLITNHPMVEVSVESDQVGFEAAVGKNGNEIAQLFKSFKFGNGSRILTKNLSYLNLNISRTQNGRNKL